MSKKKPAKKKSKKPAKRKARPSLFEPLANPVPPAVLAAADEAVKELLEPKVPAPRPLTDEEYNDFFEALGAPSEQDLKDILEQKELPKKKPWWKFW